MSTQGPEVPSSDQEPDEADVRYEAAKRRAQELQGFYIHLIVYVVVNAGLFAINAITRGDGAWWFYWPLAGWGIGLLVHAATLLRIFSPDWVEQKAREALDRSEHT